jgi:hypothetical protein
MGRATDCLPARIAGVERNTGAFRQEKSRRGESRAHGRGKARQQPCEGRADHAREDAQKLTWIQARISEKGLRQVSPIPLQMGRSG